MKTKMMMQANAIAREGEMIDWAVHLELLFI